VRYLRDLLTTAEQSDGLGLRSEGVLKTASRVNELVDKLTDAIDALARQNQELGGDDILSKAEHMRVNIIPAMTAVRDVVDRLERIVPDDLWPVPTYREMLFVK
jgi:glutamine synthetase